MHLFPLCHEADMPALLALSWQNFEYRTLLEYRRRGYPFAWIAQQTGLTERQIEDTQFAALRLLAGYGMPPNGLRRDYRLSREELAQVLAKD